MFKEKVQKIIRENLNDEQYKAATYNWKKNSIIIAGAWSGKTWTLSYKVINLLSLWVDEEKICVITFTNKAAKEIKHRIVKVQKDLWMIDTKISMWTFHSIFFQILKEIFDKKEEFWLKTEYTKNVSIENNNSIIVWLVCEQEFWSMLSWDNLTKIIWEIKNKWLYLEKDIKDYLFEKKYDEIIYTVYKKYQKLMEKQNILDFDDILLLWLKYAYENEKVKKFIENKFEYICIDEAQDTNTVQFELLKLFKANLTYIWDDFQSIYKFRWAQMQTFLEIWKDKNVEIFTLLNNYRSLDHIVWMWNNIIKHNDDQFEKEQISFRWKWEWEFNRKIYVTNYDNQFQEMKQCLIEMKEYKEQHKELKWSDFAVLYRVNQQSELLEKYAKELWIHYIVRSNKLNWVDFQIDIFMSLLKYLTNKKDATSLVKVLKFLYTWSSNYYDLFFDITNWKTLDNIIWSRKKDKNEFIEYLYQFKKKIEWLEFKLLNFNEKHLIKIWMIFWIKQNVIWKVISLYKQYLSLIVREDEITCKNFVDWYTLWDFSFEDWVDDALNLMTIHSSKWLEFHFVYIVWLQDWIFPLQQSIKTKIDTEEERRLFYVAITRAKDVLKMSYSLQKIHFWKLSKSKKSRFLNELWNNNIKIIDKTFYNSKLEEEINKIDLEEVTESLF